MDDVPSNESLESMVSNYEKQIISLETRIQNKGSEICVLSHALNHLLETAKDLLNAPLPKDPIKVEWLKKPLPSNFLSYRLNESCFEAVLDFLSAEEIKACREVSRHYNYRVAHYIEKISKQGGSESQKLVRAHEARLKELGKTCIDTVDFNSFLSSGPSKDSLQIFYSLLTLWNINAAPKWENVVELLSQAERLAKTFRAFKLCQLDDMTVKRTKFYLTELSQDSLSSSLSILYEYVRTALRADEELRGANVALRSEGRKILLLATHDAITRKRKKAEGNSLSRKEGRMEDKKGSLRFKGNVKPGQILKSMAQGKILTKRPYSSLEDKEQAKSNSDKKDFNLKRDEGVSPYQTPAELVFNNIRKKRMLERVEKKLETTHKEKIEKFSQTLAKLPEHFDIPKVGPG